MAYFEQVTVADQSGNPVNTATEATLLDIKAAVTVGELLQAIEALRIAVNALTHTAGMMTIDTGGNIRTVLSSGTVTTVNAVTSLNQLNGINSQELLKLGYTTAADQLRRNISVT